jgi:formylglycine-generating enzyme required for sulfatase activity
MSGNRSPARLGVVFAACALVFPSACSSSAPPAPTTTVPASVPSPKEILADLAKWDAAATQARRTAAEDVARRLPDFALLRLETFSCGGQTHEVAIYAHERTGLEFVLVPAGPFSMGSPVDEEGRQSDETQHPVTLTRPFLIARTDCTQAAYEKVVGTNPSYFKGATLPVETVSWEDAKSFCGKAGLELPTEAQWECACRAGTTTAYYFGDAPPSFGEWHSEKSGDPTHPVAQKKPNAFGLYDVRRDVWEWCEDRYGDYPTGAVTDPTWASGGPNRVIRGGCWNITPENARSAARDSFTPGDRQLLIGFRPAKTVPTE